MDENESVTPPGVAEPESRDIPPDEVLLEMFGLLEAQGAGPFLDVVRHAHRQRGLRLFRLMTETFPVPPGLDQALRHFAALEDTFDRTDEVRTVTVLVRRAGADMESAIEALLTGRRSIVADEMRDAMEIEHLLRDFAARHDFIDLWVSLDDQARARKFRPAEVRRRLANDAYPGKGYDLPDKREYEVHSAGLHPTPDHPHSAKALDEGADSRDLLSGAGEMLEHCRRVFDACDRLLDSFDIPDDVRPPRWQTLDRMAAAWEMWNHWMTEAKARLRQVDPNALPPREPTERRKSGPSDR